MKRFIKSENGSSTMVEAAIWVPFSVILVLAIYFVALFLCMKANLQANLQSALIYFKNPISDSYVGVTTGGLTRSYTDGIYNATGATYSHSDEYLNPYRGIWSGYNNASLTADLNTYFKEMAGNQFFAGTDSISLEVNAANYIVFKTIQAKATQRLVPGINLSMFGIKNEMVIEVESNVVISNPDIFITDTDFLIDIVTNTKFGKKVGELVEKGVELYNKFKGLFGLNPTE